jgi:hypothetical protein
MRRAVGAIATERSYPAAAAGERLVLSIVVKSVRRCVIRYRTTLGDMTIRVYR